MEGDEKIKEHKTEYGRQEKVIERDRKSVRKERTKERITWEQNGKR